MISFFFFLHLWVVCHDGSHIYISLKLLLEVGTNSACFGDISKDCWCQILIPCVMLIRLMACRIMSTTAMCLKAQNILASCFIFGYKPHCVIFEPKAMSLFTLCCLYIKQQLEDVDSDFPMPLAVVYAYAKQESVGIRDIIYLHQCSHALHGCRHTLPWCQCNVHYFFFE